MFKTTTNTSVLDGQAINNALRERAVRARPDTETWQTAATLDWLRDHNVNLPSAMSDVMRKSCMALSSYLYHGKPSPTDSIFRLASVRVKANELVSGPTRWTAYGAPRYQFGEQGFEETDLHVRRECLTLAESFLSDTDYGAALRATAPHWERTHRAFVHFDFYPARTYAQVGFHKDTWGYTLFVGLLYLNEEPIQGPDIIRNPHKLTKLYDFSGAKPPIQKLPPTLAKPRPDPFLPSCFLDPIKALIEENEKSKMVIERTGIVPKYGMISFIDELVHHSTPQAIPELPNALPCGVDDGTYYKLSGAALRDDREAIREVNQGAYRTFIRVWVTLVPDDKGLPVKSRPSSENDTRRRLKYRYSG